MNKIHLILICLFYFFPNALSGQYNSTQIISIDKNKYLLGQNIYHYDEMAHIFKGSMDDILLYRKSIKNFEAAKILGYSSLATIPVGVLLIVNNSQDGFFSAEEGFLGTSDYVGSVLIGLMPILGTTGLIIHANAKRSRKELIDSFNSNRNFRDGSAFGIQLIPAQQGLGLGLRVSF